MQVLNVTNSLFSRILITMVVLLFSVTAMAQTKYFLFEPHSSDKYNYYHNVLKTDSLYGVKEQVEVFNFLYTSSMFPKAGNDEQNLVLFSVLPDLAGDENWQEISVDSMQNNIVSFSDLKKLLEEHTMTRFDRQYGERTKFFNTYKLVLKRADKYYTPKFCLLQFYVIRNRPEPFNNVFGTINTETTPISILDFERLYKEIYPSTVFPLYTLRSPVYSSTFDRLRDRREYLSAVIDLNGTKAYRFWTYTDWHTHTFDYEVDRGIDRFIYVPGKGIVGGSFDFYFYFHRRKIGFTIADFIENIRKEKIMLAEEFIDK